MIIALSIALIIVLGLVVYYQYGRTHILEPAQSDQSEPTSDEGPCVVSDWSYQDCVYVSDCDLNGTKVGTRTRVSGNVAECPALSQTIPCSRKDELSDWTACTYSSNICGTKGEKTRTRSVQGVVCETQTEECTLETNCDQPCDTYEWSDFGACEYAGSCENTGTRTRTKTAPSRCGGIQTETVVWNHQMATADKPYCSAGRWEMVDSGQCERTDGVQCGSLGGFKDYMAFVTGETTCETPQPRKTACSLPACDISEPLSGYYRKESGICPAEHEIQTSEECKNALSGYANFKETNLGPFRARCYLNGDTLYYNTSPGSISGTDIYNQALCKGEPLPETAPVTDGMYEIHTNTAQCPSGKELNETECHSPAVKNLIRGSEHNPTYTDTFIDLSRDCIGCNLGCYLAGHMIIHNTYTGKEPPVYTSKPLLCKK